jgi:TatD DNase family protein
MEDFAPDREAVISRAYRAGVTSILCPADLSDPQSLDTAVGLAGKHPAILLAAGVHPHQAKRFLPEHEIRLRDLAQAGFVRAVGEIGLDFHYSFSTPGEQRDAFGRQLALAQELGLPAVIHSRDAGREISATVEELRFGRGGVLHCFTEDWETAQRMIGHGFYISFSGILTFPRAQALRDVAKKIPAERLLIETDCPYLSPVPFRHIKRNEPAFILETAKVLAGIRKMPLPDLAAVTKRNFQALFSFEKNDRQC